MEKKKVLIICGFVVSILVIMLSVVMIVKTSNEVKQDKNCEVLNNTKVKGDLKENTKSEEKEEKKEKIDENKNISELNDLTLKFPYSSTISGDNSYEKILSYGIDKTSGCCYTVCDGAKTQKCDDYIKEYEEYDKNKEYYSQTQAMLIYDAGEVLKTIKKVYKDVELRDKEMIDLHDFSIGKFIYLKDINKIIYYTGGGGVTGWPISIKEILDTSFSNNIYKIKYIDGEMSHSTTDLSCYMIDNNNNKRNINCNLMTKDGSTEREEYVDSHKDEFPQYEVSFKINSDNTYEFIDVVKVN